MQNDSAHEKGLYTEEINNLKQAHVEEISMIQTTVSTAPLIAYSNADSQEDAPDGCRLQRQDPSIGGQPQREDHRYAKPPQRKNLPTGGISSISQFEGNQSVGFQGPENRGLEEPGMRIHLSYIVNSSLIFFLLGHGFGKRTGREGTRNCKSARVQQQVDGSFQA